MKRVKEREREGRQREWEDEGEGERKKTEVNGPTNSWVIKLVTETRLLSS